MKDINTTGPVAEWDWYGSRANPNGTVIVYNKFGEFHICPKLHVTKYLNAGKDAVTTKDRAGKVTAVYCPNCCVEHPFIDTTEPRQLKEPSCWLHGDRCCNTECY
jgi:hypothetical protein